MNPPPEGAPAGTPDPRRKFLLTAGGLVVLMLLAIGAYWWWRPAAEGIVSLPRLDAAAAERLQVERIEQANRLLERDIDALRNAAPGAVETCPPGTSLMSPQGRLILPGGGAISPGAGQSAPPLTGDKSVDRTVPPIDPASQAAPDAKNSPGAKPNPDSKSSPEAKPPDPNKMSPAGALAALGNAALADKLERATAIVVSEKGTGTGFFINDKLMITNRHVVEGSSDNIVALASHALGVKRRGTVLRMTSESGFGNPDFALIRLDEGSAPGFLELSSHADKLNPIVAAGYPGLAIKADPAYQRLMRGDGTAAPDLNLTQGVVQSLRDGEGGLPLVLHTATILPGNSGGPLVDACGRVIGVNTYFTQDKEKFGKLSYALGVGALLSFLQASGGQTRDDVRPCA